MNVREVMTTNVVSATPDTTLEEIAALMKNLDTGAIPVVDEGDLIGIITDRDIVLRCVAEGRDPAELNVEDILSEDIEVVDPDTKVEEALEIMGRRQIRRLPVVENGELVGMVSLGDLAVKQGDQQETAETLRDVSQGVKHSRHPMPAAHHATSSKAESARTGITNDIEEEARRQARVVSIRPDANALPREQRKSGKRKAG